MFSSVFLLAVETESSFRWSNVTDGDGIAIAITGMLIVFSALALITCAIAALPHMLAAIAPYLPTIAHDHKAAPPAESLPSDQERVAAIGMVLYSEMREAIKQ